MGRLTRTNSGHENIVIKKSGNFCVTVFNDHLGTFKDVEMAIKIRDDYRKKHGLRPAKY